MLEIWMERSPSFGPLPDSWTATRRRTSISPRRYIGRAFPRRQSANFGKPRSSILTSNSPRSESWRDTLRKTVGAAKTLPAFILLIRLHLHIDNANAGSYFGGHW